MKTVNDCQALTVSQLITLFWNSPNPAYTRLRQLKEFGYLETHYITQITAGPAASPQVFTISRLGATVLAEQFGYSDGDFHFKSPQITNWKSFQPIKNTNDIRVALTRACWDEPAYTLKEWRGEVQFRAKPDVVYIDRKPVPVYPDGFCVVATQQTRTHNFIESDNGTEGLRQVVRQMQIYLEYTKSGLYEKAFGTHFWRVLLVTNSKRRLDNVRKRIAEIGGGINFWFTTADRISPQAILAEPIWYGIRGEEQHPFMGS